MGSEGTPRDPVKYFQVLAAFGRFAL